MKKFYVFSSFLTIFLFVSLMSSSQVVTYSDNWDKQGITLQNENLQSVKINYSLTEFAFEDLDIDGEPMKSIMVSDVFLPNDEGAPNLPGTGKYIVVPNGATVQLKIVSSRTEVLKNQNIAPAPRIPLDTEKGPLHYEKNNSIYSKNTFYPAEPVIVSELTKLRGIDVVMLGITPFQYNPVTKELIVYKDIEIEISFIGGTSTVGDERLRSRWWDNIIGNAVLNNGIIPKMDYNKAPLATDSPDYEYLIITEDDPDFLAWADSIKLFRTLQGIYTGIVTTNEIGGNTVSAIETYVDNAYNTWAVPPSAVLLLGDYGTSSSGINSQIFTHPAGYPDFVSDNQFADVDGDDLPDIAFARITANDAAQLEVMITKFLDYERNPPTNVDFYDHPITALGWQTERWFQICSEVVGGYLKNVHGKNPIRINAVYDGNPNSDAWSTATNTSTVVNYFGPSGLGYIPATPQELGGFSGGTSSDVINAINSGSYMLQHRDHGNYSGWGEPAFTSTSINSLNNVNNELPFIFSINCQTGAFHRSSETFTEKFHRHTYNGQNSGALGLIAATEVSYSFVNDTYVWGLFDNLHPDFMPGYSTTFPVNYVMPAFGNAAAKHFLYQSSWPYNTSNKQITYRLFHHHGDAFMTLYTEVPQSLSVAHSPALQAGATSFGVTADAGSFIALTVNGAIISTADGTGSEVLINIPQQNPGDVMIVTVTKQNFYRYSSNVDVVSAGLSAQFLGTPTTLCIGGSVTFTDQSFGSPTSWDWSFPGGTPSSYSGQTPPSIVYNTLGTYNVTLTVGDGTSTDDEIKTAYINVEGISADFTGNPTTLLIGNSVSFTDISTCDPLSWNWSFPGGTPSTSTDQNPVITYNTGGTYSVTLVVDNGIGNDTEIKTDYITVSSCSYCDIYYSNTSDDYISKVVFNTIDNSSASTNYSDFTAISTDATQDNTYTISVDVTVNGSWTQHCLAWFDWNGNCDFDDAGEVFDLGQTPGTSGTHTLSVDVTIPADANLGSTRMRVAENYNADPTSCQNGSYGEAEDYTINILEGGVVDPPVADFTADQTTILEGESVTFSDLSTNTPDTWAWTFTGGSPALSTQQNPVVIYAIAGTYNVSLTASNEAGSDNETKTAYITVNVAPPVADFTASATTIFEGETVDFTDLSSNDPTSWSWSFTGGTPATSTLQNPQITYATAGSYNVSLTATNAGGSDTETKTAYITVTVLPPVADFSADITTIQVGESVTFSDLSTNTPTSWSWSFEGGTPATSTLQNPVIAYATAGTYDVTLIATNGGGSDTETKTGYITVTNIPPVADFTASSTTIFEGETVDFTDLTTNDPTSWSWSFTGGTPSTSSVQNPSVTYATAGVYTVSLTASNDAGSDDEIKVDYITVNVQPPVADFTASSTYILVGESVSFTDLTTENPTSWSWSFDGGTPAISTDQNPTVTYNSVGIFNVSLTATNAGGSDTETKTGYIEVWDGSVTYCTAGGNNWSTEWIEGVDFGSFSNPSGASGYSDFTSQVINVENELTYTVILDPGFSGRSRREFWRVWIDYNGDGDFTDLGEEVIAANGKKNQVTASVTIPAGVSGTTRMRVAMKYNSVPTSCETFANGEVEDYTIYIGEPVPQPPVANFSGTPTNLAPGESVQFTDESSNNPTSLSWSFPGGTPSASTDQNPLIVYNSVGTFDVTLTATNGVGSDGEIKTGYIIVSDDPPPEYCASTGLSNANEWIAGVTIDGNVNNSGAAGYTDFTSIVLSLAPGSTVNVALTPGYSGKVQKEFWRIWIDFNGDNDFEDADEQVLAANNKRGVVNSSFSIPSYAGGQTRMRVSMKSGSSPAPCETFSKGEVEDYTVSFGAKGAFGNSDISQSKFEIYPNPVHTKLNVISYTDEAEILISDIRGKVIKQIKTTAAHEVIDISDLENGIYILSIITKNETYSERIIKL